MKPLPNLASSDPLSSTRFSSDLLQIAFSSCYINEKNYLSRLCELLYLYTDYYLTNNSLFDNIELSYKIGK